MKFISALIILTSCRLVTAAAVANVPGDSHNNPEDFSSHSQAIHEPHGRIEIPQLKARGADDNAVPLFNPQKEVIVAPLCNETTNCGGVISRGIANHHTGNPSRGNSSSSPAKLRKRDWRDQGRWPLEELSPWDALAEPKEGVSGIASQYLKHNRQSEWHLRAITATDVRPDLRRVLLRESEWPAIVGRVQQSIEDKMAFQIRYIIPPRLFASFVRQLSRSEQWDTEFSDITKDILSHPPPDMSKHFNNYDNNFLRTDARLGALWEHLMLEIASVNPGRVLETDWAFPGFGTPLVPLFDWSIMSRSEAIALGGILHSIEPNYLHVLAELTQDFTDFAIERDLRTGRVAIFEHCVWQSQRIRYWAYISLQMALSNQQTNFMPESATRTVPLRVTVLNGLRALLSLLRSLVDATSV